MLYTKLIGKTLRYAPYQSDFKCFELLQRAGYIRPFSTGAISFLPLGQRVIDTIVSLIETELVLLQGQKVLLPFFTPIEIWRASRRDNVLSNDLIQVNISDGSTLVLSPGFEEAMVDMVRSCIESFEDLPVFLYHMQLQHHNAGMREATLQHSRETWVVGGYSFHRSSVGLNNFFPKIFSACRKVFAQCGLSLEAAEVGVNVSLGKKAYAFYYPAENAIERIIHCDTCGYRAHSNIASAIKDPSMESLKAVEMVEFTETQELETVCTDRNIQARKRMDAHVYLTLEGYVMVLLRGDYEPSIEKINRMINVPVIRKAGKQELLSLGLNPDQPSPLTRNDGFMVIADDLIENSSNLCCVNETGGGLHLNANFGRDFEADKVGDLTVAKAQNRCKLCGTEMKEFNAMSIGEIIKLEDYYCKSLGLVLSGENGKKGYPVMGSYRLNLGALLAAIVTEFSDEKGLKLPFALAPYKVYVITIGNSLKVWKYVRGLEQQYHDILLLDDRDLSAQQKLEDCNLMGIPYRILITTEGYKENEIEFKCRHTNNKWLVKKGRVADEIERLMKQDGS